MLRCRTLCKYDPMTLVHEAAMQSIVAWGRQIDGKDILFVIYGLSAVN